MGKIATSYLTANMPPPIPAFSLMGVFSPLHVVPVAALMLLALFAPSDVLDRVTIAKALTSCMVSKWPVFGVHANSTQHQQVALLVNCLTVALIPVMMIAWWIQVIFNFPILIARSRLLAMPLGHRLFLIAFGAPLCLFALYALIGLPGDPSWARGFTTQRRVGMAFLNGSALWLSSLAIAFWPFQLWMFLMFFCIERVIKQIHSNFY